MTGENPKEACGRAKVSHSCMPLAPLAEVAVAMTEGGRKYGRHNYRASNITASIYYDACRRHIDAWFEGEDVDPDSGLHHVVKAIASLLVLRDCMITGHLADDRPPKVPEGHREHVQNLVNGVLKKFPECKEPITDFYLKNKENMKEVGL